ncbi:MAG: carbohydrate porin [Kofleriaceae bacterium]
MVIARCSLVAIGLAALAHTAAAQPATPPAPEEPAPPADGPVAAEPLPLDPTLVELSARVQRLEGELAALRAAPRVEPAPAATPPSAPASDWREPFLGFRFGSYGRVTAGTDLAGGKPQPIHVVAHGPRIVEPSYLELDFSYGARWGHSGLIRTILTLAYDDQLFHDTGAFTAGPALRNLYVIAEHDDHAVWVGSRMLRGDDLYLFDYWPLDDLNTVGAGGELRLGRDGDDDRSWLDVAAHVGLNRLRDPFQYQERAVADPELGATTVVQLNRQRTIASARAAYTRLAEPDAGGRPGINLRATLYGELHGIGAGTRRRTSDATLEALPRDWGTTLGAELTAWRDPGDADRTRAASLFVKWSKGLAAFDELAAPTSFDAELRTFPKASELVIGAGGSWDAARYHLVAASYLRRFVDADVNTRDRDDGWEYAVDLRPAVRLHHHGVYAALDLGYEARFPRGLQPTTQAAADPAIVSAAPMLTFHPTGASAWSRPELRLVYRAAHQNDGALALYAPEDPRARTWTHFLGVSAEWWFNSNSYR